MYLKKHFNNMFPNICNYVIDINPDSVILNINLLLHLLWLESNSIDIHVFVNRISHNNYSQC